MRAHEMQESSVVCAHEAPISCNSLSKSDQRTLVFHLLYAMDATDYSASLESVAENFGRGFSYVIQPEDAVFQEAQAIVENRQDLDEQIVPLLTNWRFERLGVNTRLILRMALWELQNTNTESSVIINEAIELAKSFAEQDAYKFINGILDQWVKKNTTEKEAA